MQLLSEDDLDLRSLSDAELDHAWDLWFDLAQETNDFDPPYEHGVFVLVGGTTPHSDPQRAAASSDAGPESDHFGADARAHSD